jgi:hypothetical protein
MSGRFSLPIDSTLRKPVDTQWRWKMSAGSDPTRAGTRSGSQ